MVKHAGISKGTPQLDENGNPAIFKKRNEAKMQRDWDGASEFGVDVPGRSNKVRILRQGVGSNSNGDPMYKYGWTDDHYKNIHDIEVKPPTRGK